MRIEIGSEFWSIPVGNGNNLFPKGVQWFRSGRSALEQIIADIQKKKNAHTAALPSWCCDSMIKPFLNAGIEVKFYPVFGRVQIPEVLETDITLIMDYFGYSSGEAPSGFCGTLIHDVTHSLFTSGFGKEEYSFGSLRKWAGFWTGGFALGLPSAETDVQKDYVSLREKAMKYKEEYIQGISNDKSYLKVFSQAEDMLEESGIPGAAQRDIQMASCMDIDYIRNRRRENARYLLNAFADIAVFPELSDADCPMFVPVCVPNEKRDLLRRYLIEQEIYCPVHWPVSEWHKIDEQTSRIYKEELSLVCDQRYTIDDMDRLVRAIKKFWKV